MKENIIIGCIVLLLAMICWAITSEFNDCERKGGILMRGAFGNVCLDAKVVK